VVVPSGFDHSRIPGLLARKRAWLEKTGARFDEQRAFLTPEMPGTPPDRIALRAIGQEWSIQYRSTGAPYVAALERPGQRLLVYGAIDQTTRTRQALARWVSRKAHEHLVPWLRRLADEGGFDLRRILVKSQRTRWASCSRHRAISINRSLVFLPGHLIRYVFLHELAHSRHLDHSRQFWNLLATLEPNYWDLDTELRGAWRLLPAWLIPPSPSDRTDVQRGTPDDLP
jgi:predicted metal-dependent hydrolase